jgi:hypothetical protein
LKRVVLGIVHAIVHDCLEQPFEPSATRSHISWSRDQNRDQFVERAVDDTPKCARGRVDVLKGRLKAFDKRDDSFSRKYAIRLGDRPDFTDCLFEPLCGQGGAAPAIGIGTKLGLKSPPV